MFDVGGILVVTQKAIDQLKLALAEEKQAQVGIRIGVRGGGCSGYQYVLDTEDSPKEYDFSYDIEGVKFYIDAMSAPYLRGTNLDYLESLQASGFKFSNPNAVKTCGCGSSVAF